MSTIVSASPLFLEFFSSLLLCFFAIITCVAWLSHALRCCAQEDVTGDSMTAVYEAIPRHVTGVSTLANQTCTPSPVSLLRIQTLQFPVLLNAQAMSALDPQNTGRVTFTQFLRLNEVAAMQTRVQLHTFHPVPHSHSPMRTPAYPLVHLLILCVQIRLLGRRADLETSNYSTTTTMQTC